MLTFRHACLFGTDASLDVGRGCKLLIHKMKQSHCDTNAEYLSLKFVKVRKMFVSNHSLKEQNVGGLKDVCHRDRDKEGLYLPLPNNLVRAPTKA